MKNSRKASGAENSGLCQLVITQVREILEPSRQPVSIRVILTSSRQLDRLLGDSLEAEFEKCAIMDFEEPVRDMDAEIGVDPDQLSVKGRMAELGQRQAIRDDRLT